MFSAILPLPLHKQVAVRFFPDLMSSITSAIRRLGLPVGIRSYLQVKAQRPTISLPELRHPVRLRPHTTDGLVFKQIFFAGEYDFQPPFQPKHIIDAGANIGLFAVLMASRYPDARILCVEPEPENFGLLQANTTHYAGIVPVQAGIWSREAHLEVVSEGHREWSFEVRETAASQPHAIPAVSIGSLIEAHSLPVIDILKMDVEGAEANIFSDNFENWLPKTKMIIIELHEDWLPGSSTSFWNALNRYQFTHTRLGENWYFINEAL